MAKKEDDAALVSITFRAPAELARALDAVTSAPLAPSRTAVVVHGLRLAIADIRANKKPT